MVDIKHSIMTAHNLPPPPVVSNVHPKQRTQMLPLCKRPPSPPPRIDYWHVTYGRYAFTESVQAFARQTKCFRVLALSETPGRTQHDVAEVCRNLLISHLEIRWDNSIDVSPYIPKRHMQTVVVSLGEQIQEIRQNLLQIIDPYLRQLIEAEVLSGHKENINRNFLLYEQKKFRERSLRHGNHPLHATVNSNFRHFHLKSLMQKIKQQVEPNPFEVSAGVMTNGQIAMPKDLDFRHPKFEKARECLLKHFQENSWALVFCEYSESVLLIYRMLLQEKPLLRPRCFVGQGGSSGGLRAFTQQQQIQIMNDFRSGKSNILIATSIGEGGIDVGEVDLITCFDISSANPTRFIQRIGRIGRQSNDKIVTLVTERREKLLDVTATKDQLNKKLLRSQIVKQSLYQHSQRLLPRQLTPTCIRSFIKPIEKELKEVKVKKTKTTPKAKGKVNQDLRKYFNSKKCEEDKAVEFFQLDPTPKETNPGSYTQQCMQKKFERIEDLLKDFEGALTTNACEENQLLNVPLNKEMVERQVKNIGIDPKHTSKINKFLETRQNSRGVLLRAETTDLAQHLKPSEMSNEMKIALLELNPKIYRAKLGKYDSFERSRL
ncbi:LOW QUALITY PROTEIN: DEAD-box ATP-dependent DNA helicase Fancm-like [Glossina fuscipes fuscipes]